MNSIRTSPDQFEILLEYMERYSDLSKPLTGLQGRIRADHLWRDLVECLNSAGGGVQKTEEKWKKVWADWKTKTKKKWLTIRRTGGGPSSRQTLTALEERVLALVKQSSGTGQDAVDERGFALQPIWIGPYSEPNQPAVEGLTSAPTDNQPRAPVDDSEQVSGAPLSPLLLQAATAPSTSRRGGRFQRRRRLMPFERAADAFISMERKRLESEENRDARLHEREVERERLLHERELEREGLLHERELERERLLHERERWLHEREIDRIRVESQSLEVDQSRIVILQRLTDLLQTLSEVLQARQ